MTYKPWETKSVLDVRKSTKKDYPPKRKLPSHNESFTEMEQYHHDNFSPWGEHPIARKVRDNCRGRVLRPVTQETWGCEGRVRQLEDAPPQFQVGASGGIGALTYSIDPRWREVNEAGDQVTIDGSGVLQIGDEETIVCSDGWPPWIIYKVCDDCGCSHGTIWLEDCSGDCLDCDACDCDSEDDCVADCCFTSEGPVDETTTNTTKQFSCSQSGTWDVTGTGATIDQTGLLTTDGTACGTLVVSHTGCGDQEVRVTDNGGWSLVCSADSDNLGGGGCVGWQLLCDTTSGGTRLINSHGPLACDDVVDPCPLCGIPPEGRKIVVTQEFSWVC